MTTDESIKSRKTEKILATQPWDIKGKNITETVEDLLQLAAHAPFHLKRDKAYDMHTLKSAVPWRFYNLDTKNCRQLAHWIEKEKIQSGKLLNMIFAADALLIVTWLPNNASDEENRKVDMDNEAIPFNGNINNMEHIAATACAIQNVLLGATARNIPSYWSTGGAIRQRAVREKLNISLQEILLGVIFLFPKESDQQSGQIFPGKLRALSKDVHAWSRWASLND